MCVNHNVVVLSEPIKEKLSKIAFNKIFVTDKPNEESIIKMFDFFTKSEKF